MNITSLRAALVLSGALLAASVHAADSQIDPGLWEIDQQVKLSQQGDEMNQMMQQVRQMQQEMKNLPPEARAMVERQLSNMNINIGDDGNMKVKLRNCLTPAEAAEDFFREGRKEGDCTMTKVQRKGKQWRGELVCDGEDMKGTGKFTATLHSRQHYSMDASINSPQDGTMQMKMEARRISADCS